MAIERYSAQIKASFNQGKYNFLASCADILSILIFNLILARTFNPAIFGQVKTTLTVATIVLTLFDFGFPVLLQSESLNGKINNIFGKILFIKLTSFAIYSFSVFGYTLTFFPDIQVFIIILIILSSYIQSLSLLFYSVFYGKERIEITFASILVSRSVLIFACILMTQYKLTVYVYLLILTFSYSLQLVVLLKNLKHLGISLRSEIISIRESIKIIAVVIPLGINIIFYTIYGKVDVLIIAKYLDFNSVAQYNIPYTIYKLSGMVFSVFLIPAFNIFTKNREDPQVNFQNLITQIYIITVLAICIDLFYIFAGTKIIMVLFGEKYLQGAKILPYFSISVIALGLNSLTGIYLNANQKYRSTLVTTFIGILINIPMNLLLVKKIGIMGAVISSMVTEVWVFISQYVYIQRNKNNWLQRNEYINAIR